MRSQGSTANHKPPRLCLSPAFLVVFFTVASFMERTSTFKVLVLDTKSLKQATLFCVKGKHLGEE